MKSPLGLFTRDNPSRESTDRSPDSTEQSNGFSRRIRQVAIAGALVVFIKRVWEQITRTSSTPKADMDGESTGNTTESTGRALVGAIVAIAIMGVVTYRLIRHRG